MENKNVDISIVIPVYGSENVLEELTSQIKLAAAKDQILFGNYEIIFVCDNSPDHSWDVINQIALNNANVLGLLLRINAGQHNAIMAGLTVASGRIIVTMDDDIQHSPFEINLLLSGLIDDVDVIYGKFKNRKHAYWKILGSRLNNFVAGYLIKKPKELYLSPFRAMRRSIVLEIIKYTGPYVYIDGLILSVTRRIASVDVNHYGRYAGGSGYSFGKSLSLWLKMATNFSIAPLRLTSLLGIFFSVIGFLFAILFIIQKFTLNLMPNGWSSIMVAILIIGGVQLLALGMIGEYLGRVLLTINQKPQYVVADSINLHNIDNVSKSGVSH